MAKKMILVPHDFMSKLGQQQRLEPSGDLDSEMKRMLDNSQLDDRDRWTQYQQMLQRYLRLKEQERQPLKVAVEESRDGVLSTLSKEVVDSVPVAYRRKAKLLLQRLEDSDDIKWDSRGEVTIRGEKITDSNITDLVGDVVRARKNTNPVGWQMFADLLKVMNMPHEFIGNTRRIAYMTNKVQAPVIEGQPRAKRKRPSISGDGWSGFRF